MTMTDSSRSSQTIEELIESTKANYYEVFPKSSTDHKNNLSKYYTTTAPGRVNLIGEHVDYNGGYVLPMAINYYTVCYGTGRVIRKNSSSNKNNNIGTARICAMNINPLDVLELPISKEMTPLEDPECKWANYILGVVKEYWNHYLIEDGSVLDFSIAIQGNIPLGAGLSSSASIEIAVAKLLECIILSSPTDEVISHKSRALHCQKAENTFCSSPCGIMDQYICSAAKHNNALFIDCTTYNYDYVPFVTDDVAVVICNSNVTHSIADGEYPVRVQQCKKALSIIQNCSSDDELKNVPSLRFVSLDQLESVKEKFFSEQIVYNRAYHVITEDQRTIKAKQALKNNDFITMGQLMCQSHMSLRDYYQVSCNELDILVQLAQNYRSAQNNKVYGSRMTGGGFGGCTVTLLKKEMVQDFIIYLEKEYEEKALMKCSCFVSSAVAGVQCII